MIIIHGLIAMPWNEITIKYHQIFIFLIIIILTPAIMLLKSVYKVVLI